MLIAPPPADRRPITTHHPVTLISTILHIPSSDSDSILYLCAVCVREVCVCVREVCARALLMIPWCDGSSRQSGCALRLVAVGGLSSPAALRSLRADVRPGVSSSQGSVCGEVRGAATRFHSSTSRLLIPLFRSFPPAARTEGGGGKTCRDVTW